jgi:hypothetical protein
LVLVDFPRGSIKDRIWHVRRRMDEHFLEEVPLLLALTPYQRSKIADALEAEKSPAGHTIIFGGESAGFAQGESDTTATATAPARLNLLRQSGFMDCVKNSQQCYPRGYSLIIRQAESPERGLLLHPLTGSADSLRTDLRSSNGSRRSSKFSPLGGSPARRRGKQQHLSRSSPISSGVCTALTVGREEENRSDGGRRVPVFAITTTHVMTVSFHKYGEVC